ncbi:hypothetical protein SDC9_190622 [bioreactor metagenome]|uniref:Uncharacterized protein n=1 Tax=bioreactor metagenome TaxID=1076179 RepID=A0A645I6I6_9ZZZZ
MLWLLLEGKIIFFGNALLFQIFDDFINGLAFFITNISPENHKKTADQTDLNPDITGMDKNQQDKKQSCCCQK